MKPKSIQLFGVNSPHHRSPKASRFGILIPLQFITTRETTSLAAVDSLFSRRRFFSSPLNRLVCALLATPFGIVLGVALGTILRTSHWVDLGASYEVAAMVIPALMGAIATLYLRYSAKTRRYLVALDLISGGNIDNMDFYTVSDVCGYVNHMIDHSIDQIRCIKLRLPDTGLQGQNELEEQIGVLSQLAKTFDGINGIYTGPARTLLSEEWI